MIGINMKLHKKTFLTVLSLMFCLETLAQEPIHTPDSIQEKTHLDSKLIDRINPSQSAASIQPFKPVINNPAPSEMTMPTMTYKLDSTRTGIIQMNLYRNNSSNPIAFDYHNMGLLSSWNKGYLYGSSGHNTIVGLMAIQNSQIGMIQQYGNFTISAGISANRYLFPNSLRTRYGINGSLSYNLSDNLSMTLFGNYSNHPLYYSMAAFPYIATSSYGGYFTLQNDNVGIDLGTERQYDPFRRQWRTVPVVTPKFKIGNMKIDLPLGELVGGAIERIMHKDSRQGPIIMPRRR